LIDKIITMSNKKMKFNTKTIHGGQIPEKGYGAVMPPYIKLPLILNQVPENIKAMNIVELITLPDTL